MDLAEVTRRQKWRRGWGGNTPAPISLHCQPAIKHSTRCQNHGIANESRPVFFFLLNELHLVRSWDCGFMKDQLTKSWIIGLIHSHLQGASGFSRKGERLSFCFDICRILSLTTRYLSTAGLELRSGYCCLMSSFLILVKSSERGLKIIFELGSSSLFLCYEKHFTSHGAEEL